MSEDKTITIYEIIGKETETKGKVLKALITIIMSILLLSTLLLEQFSFPLFLLLCIVFSIIGNRIDFSLDKKYSKNIQSIVEISKNKDMVRFRRIVPHMEKSLAKSIKKSVKRNKKMIEEQIFLINEKDCCYHEKNLFRLTGLGWKFYRKITDIVEDTIPTYEELEFYEENTYEHKLDQEDEGFGNQGMYMYLTKNEFSKIRDFMPFQVDD